MINYINSTEEYLESSQQNNFQRWNILNKIVYRELAARGSYEAEVDFLRQYVGNRISYLDNQFSLPQMFNVTASTSNSAMGSAVSNSIHAFANDQVTLTATAKDGYEFVNWTVNGQEVSIENPYTATITATTEFVANFSETTGIESAEATEQTLKAVVEDNEIKVYGTTAGEVVTVYATNGTVIANAISEDNVTTIKTTATGVLLVKVGNAAVKIVK